MGNGRSTWGRDTLYWNSGEDWQGTLPVEKIHSMEDRSGELGFLGKRLGRETVRLLSELIFQRPDALCVIAQTDMANLALRGVSLSARDAYDETNGVFTTAIFLEELHPVLNRLWAAMGTFGGASDWRQSAAASQKNFPVCRFCWRFSAISFERCRPFRMHRG
ncbi:hypothetical protein CLOSTMETH_00830 [[Clostridium] methylpentosum DSM 5476]|uniref:Uncharacterized protein n=1 Tax=[Clostridium] methylpentosum DSM 5476 TaxID=537013 RepID=C0EAH5_9FIRM|nr:hypothetical protein CLOSTMETH_00830 [[Clostridium] methylpentosum DSM 5476]MDY3988277.1 hypothetical protein [Massilioclostridium sp.]MEE1491935.1 hypothetical protein [Massilioclostridium sp.]